MQKFCFIPSSLEQTKTFRTGKINLEMVPKSSFLFPLKPRYMKTFRCDNKLIRFFLVSFLNFKKSSKCSDWILKIFGTDSNDLLLLR
jgi:hypothetical protein